MTEIQKNVTKARLTAGEIRSLYEFATSVSVTRNAEDLRKLQVQSTHVARLRDQFETAQIAVLSASTDSQPKEDKLYYEIMAMLYSIEVLCNDLFLIDKTSQTQNNTVHHTQSNTVPLPKIQLSKFTGEMVEWTNYISIFNSLVHNNTQLNGVQRLHYLLSTLHKEPLALIRHLPITEENYNVAYKLLVDRYENKRLIGDKHLEAILGLPSFSTNPSGYLRRFVATLKENLEALKALGFDVDSWSFILLHILSKKLSVDVRTRFELEHSMHAIPTFNHLLSFLEIQLKVLENVAGVKVSAAFKHNANTASCHTILQNTVCSFCNDKEHNIHRCPKFDELDLSQRKAFVQKQKLCFNCLRTHGPKCTSKYTCRVCQQRHHTKLHDNIQSTKYSLNTSTLTPGSVPQHEGAVPSLSTTVHPPVFSTVHRHSAKLLPTAVVTVVDRYGQDHRVRALLDSASHVNLLSEHVAQKLNLKRTRSGAIDPVGDSDAIHTNGSVLLTLKIGIEGERSTLTEEAWVMKRITKDLPLCPLPSEVKEACAHLELADPHFDVPGPIDLLIGSDWYFEITEEKKLRLGDHMPKAILTKFGWALMGSVPIDTNVCVNSTSVTTLACTLSLEATLQRFWEIEEAPHPPVEDPENVLCEKHFLETHSRDHEGRFTVRLPFKPGRKQLGGTHAVALKRFHNLERRLLREPALREMYVAFIEDYIEQGHMRLAEDISADRYFLPHHGVLKETSSTTKLRTVFDASTASTTGVSLNNILMPGPKLQQSIEDIILRFRLHQVVFTGDIKQMYRQVKMHNEDCKYQTILWRKSPEVPICQYELTTVTYGVSSSAYLAMRVVHELAVLNESKYPEASKALQESLFVDDIVCGSSTLRSARTLQQDIIAILSQGGFQLRKWSSNSPELLKSMPLDHLETPFRFQEAGDNVFKILGMEWSSQADAFLYHVTNIGAATTKRGILSNIARLYDPCGYLTPVTYNMKVLMQTLWLKQLDWDEHLPAEYIETWQKFVAQLGSLSQLRIDRNIVHGEATVCELHGFSDASERGYAAAVYLRVASATSTFKVNLIMAKSRVAPIKQRLTIPKLELCGALLVSGLLAHVKQILQGKIRIDSVTAWCDSLICLAWIRTPPHKLQTFESNRVSQIQGTIPAECWRHVPSDINPADCASRGLLPADIVNHPLWWDPLWLHDDPTTWPSDCNPLTASEDLPGLRVTPITCAVMREEWNLMTQYSSLSQLSSVIGWCLRFAHNCSNPANKRKGALTLQELDHALQKAIKVVQRSNFTDEIAALESSKPVKGSLHRLNPFIDANGVLRVGGRLTHSSIPYEAKHPAILPKGHHLTRILIEHYHRLYCHVGPAALTSLLHRRYWILSARNVVRHVIFKCMKCFKLKARPSAPYMGDLPASRTRPARAFERCGADFAGPFSIKSSVLRGSKVHKAYLCVFVCFATKAAHLEVVSDLTTEAFVACLSRFVSRRGLPTDIYTDCGTNFVGTRRHLDEVSKHLSATDNQNALAAGARKQQVNWHFNPPLAPHMGGLWETAVKSAKSLLKRVVGEQTLTFEELITTFARIEAVLNSRPLCPLSSDPDSIDILTPGHFLIGQPLLALPEYNYEHTPLNRLNRWKLIQHMSQCFWRRYQAEYLHTLQERRKWNKHVTNLKVGDLVIIQEPNLPPLQWKTGRITKIFPGSDGTVRVVEMKTASQSTLTRVVTRLVPLPSNEN